MSCNSLRSARQMAGGSGRWHLAVGSWQCNWRLAFGMEREIFDRGLFNEKSPSPKLQSATQHNKRQDRIVEVRLNSAGMMLL